MASPKIFTVNHTQRAFTLLEVLVVIGLFTSIAAISLFIDLNSYRGDAFRAEKTMIGTLLQKARADALNNIDQDPHGVAFFPPDHPTSYVIFSGTSYSASLPASREVFDSSYQIQISPASPTEVVFQQLSGATAFGGDITLTDPARGMTQAITINQEGLISW